MREKAYNRGHLFRKKIARRGFFLTDTNAGGAFFPEPHWDLGTKPPFALVSVEQINKTFILFSVLSELLWQQLCPGPMVATGSVSLLLIPGALTSVPPQPRPHSCFVCCYGISFANDVYLSKYFADLKSMLLFFFCLFLF